jgi:RNA polymerase sigma-70 factor (ECF subfamily)
VINQAKARKREVSIERDTKGPRSPDRALLAGESRDRVAEALAALPSGARDILLLKFRQGLSAPQIASALGVSMPAAWQQMSRALGLLRTKLSEKP